jgi:hypothetical protein
MTGEEQRTVLDFARKRGLWIVADEVYARIVYDRLAAPSFLEQAAPEDRLIVVNSFSKSWAMTGWRLGWITLPAALAPTFEMLTEYNIAGPAGFIQRAGVVAVRDGEPFVRELAQRYRAARDFVAERIAPVPRLGLAPPEAAFYAFIRVESISDSLTFAKDLLAATGVGLAPGAAFGKGGEGHLRRRRAGASPFRPPGAERVSADALKGAGVPRPAQGEAMWSARRSNARSRVGRVAAKHRRRYSAPPSPKAAPGARPTPVLLRRSLAKAKLSSMPSTRMKA